MLIYICRWKQKIMEFPWTRTQAWYKKTKWFCHIRNHAESTGHDIHPVIILKRGYINKRERLFLESLYCTIDSNTVNEKCEFRQSYTPLLRSLRTAWTQDWTQAFCILKFLVLMKITVSDRKFNLLINVLH